MFKCATRSVQQRTHLCNISDRKLPLCNIEIQLKNEELLPQLVLDIGGRHWYKFLFNNI